MWDTKMATLFLTLISVMMSIVFLLLRESNWFEKVSIKWKFGESSLFRKSQEERTLFRQLLISIIGLLIFVYYLCMIKDVAIQWGVVFLKC